MITCLEAGKAVLCEKPFTMNATAAKHVLQLAKDRGLFAMEGMWTRCFPVIQEAVKRTRAGDLGELTYIDASFCAHRDFEPGHRLYKKELGGGALLDLGVYPVSLAVMLMSGMPEVSHAHAIIGETGVDEQTVMLLGDKNGLAASLSCGFRSTTPHVAVLAGSEATLVIEDPWTRPSRAVIKKGDEVVEEIDRPVEGHGFVYEAREVMRCLREGLRESPIMPHEETLITMRVMDEVREVIGLDYDAG